jgi:glycosyltransferase involved in cell wall biosynthesis
MMMLESELVSVALCTYNGAAYLEQQLSSIVAQSYKNIEIIIVDDGSSDDTISIVKRFLEQDTRVKLYCNAKNLGFNANFSKAISLCSGAFIAISDQDDIWMPEKISKMVAAIGENLLSYHNSALIDADGNQLGKSRLTTHRFVSGFCSKMLLLNNCVSGHACLFRRELLGMVPPLPANFYYDWWLAYTAACTGRINFTAEALVLYRIHGRSITQQDAAASKLLRIHHYELFRTHPGTPVDVRLFLEKLLHRYKDTASKSFSFGLFFFMIAHYRVLFYTRRRSLFSHLKFIWRESSN